MHPAHVLLKQERFVHSLAIVHTVSHKQPAPIVKHHLGKMYGSVSWCEYEKIAMPHIAAKSVTMTALIRFVISVNKRICHIYFCSRGFLFDNAILIF